MNLPHSIESEREVLGALLIDNNNQAVSMLTPEDFYNTQHQKIFAEIQKLQTVDPVILSHRGVSDLDYLMGLVDTNISVKNSVYHAKEVKNMSIRRQTIKTFYYLVKEAQDTGKDLSDIIHEAEKQLLDLNSTKGVIKTLGGDIEGVIEMVEGIDKGDERIIGIKTGFKGIDDIIDGCKYGEITVVSGATKVGKTMFALNLVKNWSINRNLTGIYFSYEMLYKYLAYRIMVGESGVDVSNIKNRRISDSEWKKIISKAGELKQVKNLHFIDDIQPGTQFIYHNCRRIQETEGLDYVVVDHLHLMSQPGEKGGRTAEIGTIVKSLKSITNRLDIPMILLAQMNRNFEHRNPPRPRYSDLRDSAEIEQAMSADILLYCPNSYSEMKNGQEVPLDEDPTKIEAITDLHRHGETGTAQLKFNKSRMSFIDYPSDW